MRIHTLLHILTRCAVQQSSTEQLANGRAGEEKVRCSTISEGTNWAEAPVPAERRKNDETREEKKGRKCNVISCQDIGEKR